MSLRARTSDPDCSGVIAELTKDRDFPLVGSIPLEHEAIVVEQTALEAQRIRAHARHESQAEVAAGKITGQQLEIGG